MSMAFTQKPAATVKVRIQYDANGNIWESANGVEKGAYKAFTFGNTNANNTYSDFIDSSTGIFTEILTDTLGISYDEDSLTRTKEEYGQDGGAA